MKSLIAQKIKSGRILSGLSQQEVADKLAVSKQMISKYEKAESTPNGEMLIKLSDAFQVKLDYFFQENKIELKEFNFRKKSSFSLKEQLSLKEHIKVKLENYLEIEDILQIESKFQFKPIQISESQQVVQIAGELRQLWNIGKDPIHNIIQMLEDREIKVVEHQPGNLKFDGLATFINEKFPVIVINSQFSVERKRFTLLHELGHIILDFKDLDNKSVENLCNQFAGEFLFPSENVIQEFGRKRDSISVDELIEAQRKYGISIQAIIHRLASLNILSESKKTLFYKQLNANRSFKARIDESRFESAEISNRYSQLVYRALAQSLISQSKAATLLGISLDEISMASMI